VHDSARTPTSGRLLQSPIAPFVLSGGVVTLALLVAFGGETALASLAVLGTAFGVWSALVNEAEVGEMRSMIEERTTQLVTFNQGASVNAVRAVLDTLDSLIRADTPDQKSEYLSSMHDVRRVHWQALVLAHQVDLARVAGLDLPACRYLAELVEYPLTNPGPTIGEVDTAIANAQLDLILTLAED
jgi:hypothetical protein